MGYINADLLRQWTRAKRRGNTKLQKRLEGMIDWAQEACPHPQDKRTSRRCDKRSLSGKYQVGDLLEYCLCCARILRRKRQGVVTNV